MAQELLEAGDAAIPGLGLGDVDGSGDLPHTDPRARSRPISSRLQMKDRGIDVGGAHHIGFTAILALSRSHTGTEVTQAIITHADSPPAMML